MVFQMLLKAITNYFWIDPHRESIFQGIGISQRK